MEKIRYYPRKVKTAVAIFAKTPGLSPIKTRLAAGIGANLAESFYCLSVKAVEETVIQVKNISNGTVIPFWALAEPEGVNFHMWSKLPILWTGEGGLGERLYTVYTTLLRQYDNVILMGTDSPQLYPFLIMDAVRKLSKSTDRCVIGPSFDGGFYLFGGSQQISETVWTAVTYSQNDTLRQLMQQLNRLNIPITRLPASGDVDTIEDLDSLLTALEVNGEALLPAQRDLYDWLQTLPNLLSVKSANLQFNR